MHEMRETPSPTDGSTASQRYVSFQWPLPEELPETIEWEGNLPKGKLTLLQNGKRVKYSCKDGKVTVQLPKGLLNESLAFRFNVK